jgi:hypothetical protein
LGSEITGCKTGRSAGWTPLSGLKSDISRGPSRDTADRDAHFEASAAVLSCNWTRASRNFPFYGAVPLGNGLSNRLCAALSATLRSMRQRHNLAAFTTVVIIMVIVILGGGPLHDASRAMPAMASSPRRACSVFCAMAAICARHDRGSSLALRRCRRGGADGNCTVRIQRDPIDAVALTNVQISI